MKRHCALTPRQLINRARKMDRYRLKILEIFNDLVERSDTEPLCAEVITDLRDNMLDVLASYEHVTERAICTKAEK